MGLLFESLVVATCVFMQPPARPTSITVALAMATRSTRSSNDATGAWMAVEVELSPTRADEAAQSLLKACATIDAGERGETVKKVVVTATGYGYERDDGISVVPITAL